MKHLFFDSSAFVKRYLSEHGSDEVVELLEGAGKITLSVLAVPEVVSALYGALRERRISETQFDAVERQFLEQIQDIEFSEVTDKLALRTAQAMASNPLRTLDALQVATALEAGCDLFVTADKKQASGARKSGLRVHEV